MTQQRANQRALALAHIAENLAYALPAYQATIHDQLRTTTGYPDHTPGAPPPTYDKPTKPLEGHCTANVPAAAIDDLDYTSYGHVDCGRSRPCPEHDRPVTLTPTEHTANLRAHLHNELADIDQTITTTTTLLNELLQRARRALPPPPTKLERCNATNREGAIDWADPTCTNHPTRGPLCDTCSKREYRWRTARGLPKRTDGVYSQPAADVPS
jgi:hypothetical protein